MGEANMVVADNGILLLMASKVLGDDSYVDYAADQLNYILGRNAVSYCYVTGYGSQTPENPHHRPSEALGKAMTEGEKITISGFGTFEVRERAERQGINPRTREPITIAASRSIVFKPGKSLKDTL